MEKLIKKCCEEIITKIGQTIQFAIDEGYKNGVKSLEKWLGPLLTYPLNESGNGIRAIAEFCPYNKETYEDCGNEYKHRFDIVIYPENVKNPKPIAFIECKVAPYASPGKLKDRICQDVNHLAWARKNHRKAQCFLVVFDNDRRANHDYIWKYLDDKIIPHTPIEIDSQGFCIRIWKLPTGIINLSWD